MRILLAPDKYKGSLSAEQVAEAMEAGWGRVRPGDTCVRFPISDGGDGFGELVAKRVGAVERQCVTKDAAHCPRVARWWYETGSRTAWLESAEAIGLAHLPHGVFHPFELDTYGLGVLIQEAINEGARRLVVGLGGSATNDGGFGMARALGWRFWDGSGRELVRWTDLESLVRVEPPPVLPDLEVVGAVDVKNPLLGEKGASRIFGPQKGLKPSDLEPAEACLGRLERVFHHAQGICGEMAGAGAAGGLGFGLAAFLKAKLESGFGLFQKWSGLRDAVLQCDLVITGEGSLDEQSLMGKGVGEMGVIARDCGKPAWALVGSWNGESGHSRDPFSRIWGIVPEHADLQDSLLRPFEWVRTLAEKAAFEVDCGPA